MPRLYVFHLLTILTSNSEAFQYASGRLESDRSTLGLEEAGKTDHKAIPSSAFAVETPKDASFDDPTSPYSKNQAVHRAFGTLQGSSPKSPASPLREPKMHPSRLFGDIMPLEYPSYSKGKPPRHYHHLPQQFHIEGRTEDGQSVQQTQSDKGVVLPTDLFWDMFKNLEELMVQFRAVSEIQESADRDIRGPIRQEMYNMRNELFTAGANQNIQSQPFGYDDKRRNERGEKNSAVRRSKQNEVPQPAREVQSKKNQQNKRLNQLSRFKQQTFESIESQKGLGLNTQPKVENSFKKPSLKPQQNQQSIPPSFQPPQNQQNIPPSFQPQQNQQNKSPSFHSQQSRKDVSPNVKAERQENLSQPQASRDEVKQHPQYQQGGDKNEMDDQAPREPWGEFQIEKEEGPDGSTKTFVSINVKGNTDSGFTREDMDFFNEAKKDVSLFFDDDDDM